MKHNFCHTVLLLFAFSISGFSHSDSDSLLIQLDTAKGISRANLLNKISYNLQNSDAEKAEKFADEALSLSRNENYESGIANALNNKGLLFETRGQLDKAKEAYLESLALQEKMNNSELDEIIITDTIMQPEAIVRNKKITIVSVAPLLAEVIRRIETGESISKDLIL